jgi:hypothetical protein
MNKEFVFGTTTVPDGVMGDWKISTFTLTEEDVMINNLRAVRDGNDCLVCSPGTYRRLTHKTRGVVMSNTPMELRTCRDVYDHAKGRVLIMGLGMGMVLEAILSKRNHGMQRKVDFVRVVEVDPDVIALVGPHFANDPRVEIMLGDALTYKPAPGEEWDYVWHDIWDTVSEDNLPEMTKLSRRFTHRADKQGFWSREMARRERQRNNRYGW